MSSKCHILRILVSYLSTREFGICNLLSEIMNLQFTIKNTCTEMYSLLILFHAALSPCIIGITLVAKCSNTKKNKKEKKKEPAATYNYHETVKISGKQSVKDVGKA